MQVVMLKVTTWDGRRLNVGETAEVALDVAKRWAARKIARLVPREVAGQEGVGAGENELVAGGTDGAGLKTFSFAELRALAKEKGIPVVGKRKEELIEALRAVR